MTGAAQARRATFAALRAFADVRSRVGGAPRCDVCAADLGSAHEHLLDARSQALRCACAGCAALFPPRSPGAWQRVPRRAEALPDLRMTDAQWSALRLPIDLAFLVQSSAAGRVVARFPSPAGVTESSAGCDSWAALTAANPRLAGLAPDVEALLVNRLDGARGYYYVSIDVCYQLVGVVRRHWRGVAGGAVVWTEVARFLAALDGARGSAPCPT